MRFGSQSNQAPGLPAASPACPEGLPAGSSAVCFHLAAAAKTPVSLRFPAQRQPPAHPGLSIPAPNQINFAPCVPAVLDVPYLFAHEVTNNRRVDLPHQVRRENNTAIQSNDHIQPPSLALPRNLFPQGCYLCCNARRGITRSLSTAQSFSSAITIPARVLSFAANSAATGKPRAHTRTPPLVSTGQPSRSHRLTRFSFNRRFSLWALR